MLSFLLLNCFTFRLYSFLFIHFTEVEPLLSLGGIKPVAHLLHEFLLEIRYRWESGAVIPGLPSGTPDHAYGLFHQKLQMINCCIERKRAREAKVNQMGEALEEQKEETKASKPKSVSSDTDEDDEFFDCDTKEKEEDSDMETSSSPDPGSKKSDLPIWNQKPEGRSKKHGKMKLLEHDDFLYIPICQDPAPMTEDQLAEQAEVIMIPFENISKLEQPRLFFILSGNDPTWRRRRRLRVTCPNAVRFATQ